MAEIVNLRQARKRRTREREEAQAAENRISYGLTKSQKAKAGSEREKLLRDLDGAKRERPAAPETGE